MLTYSLINNKLLDNSDWLCTLGGVKCVQRDFFIKLNFCTKTLLHEGSLLHVN